MSKKRADESAEGPRLPSEAMPAAVRIARDLKRRILTLELYPGTPLREADSAERYGVSRYTIRSALQLLVSEGLVEHVPHRGASIRFFSAEDLRDVFSYREILENGAIRLICRGERDFSDFTHAVDVLEKQEAQVLAGKLKSYETTAADIEAHRALVQCSGSPRLVRAYEMLESEILLSFSLYGVVDLPVTEHEHRDVLAALERRDEAEAQHALSTMLRDSLFHLLSQWTSSGLVEIMKARGVLRAEGS